MATTTELYVRAFCFGDIDRDDDQSLPNSINIRINFCVYQTYHSSDRALKSRTRERIGEMSSEYPYHSITHDLLSRMIARLNIPFPLEKMQCDCEPQQTELQNIDDLISHILDQTRFTVNRFSESADQMIYVLFVDIERRVTVHRHEIEAMDRAKENEERVLRLHRFVSSTIQNDRDFSWIEWQIGKIVRDTAPTEKAFLDNKYEQELKLSLLERAMREYFQALETLKFEGDKEEQVLCAICTKEILIGSRITRMPCSHIYHVRCIAEWLRRSLMCPSCGFNLTTT